jgi:RES domain-containing protein
MHQMTPLPGALGGRELVAWRLDAAQHALTWDSGLGAERFGGRWNLKGRRAVYCSIDPACAIVEVAVHKGFKTLDTVAHVLTSVLFADPAGLHIVDPAAVPNPMWLMPGTPGHGQQQFGTALLLKHGIVLYPSAAASYSWNLVFDPVAASGRYALRAQHPFAMDMRLHPARRTR